MIDAIASVSTLEKLFFASKEEETDNRGLKKIAYTELLKYGTNSARRQKGIRRTSMMSLEVDVESQ